MLSGGTVFAGPGDNSGMGTTTISSLNLGTIAGDKTHLLVKADGSLGGGQMDNLVVVGKPTQAAGSTTYVDILPTYITAPERLRHIRFCPPPPAP